MPKAFKWCSPDHCTMIRKTGEHRWVGLFPEHEDK